MLIVQISNVKRQNSKFKVQSSKKKNRQPCLNDRSSLQEKYIEIWKRLKRILVKGVKHC
mgnify:CR=1 FL=1